MGEKKQSKYFAVSIVALALVATAVVLLAYVSYFNSISSETSDWGLFGDYIGGVLGTIVAGLALAALAWAAILQSRSIELERERHRAELTLAELDKTLQRAYQLFEPVTVGELPSNSRTMWLTVARMIRLTTNRAAELPESFREVFATSEFYWRSQFQEIAEPLRNAPPDYWAVDFTKLTSWSEDSRAPISPSSAKAIFDWLYEQQTTDPLDPREGFSDEEIGKLQSFYWRGLGQLLEDYENWMRELREKAAAKRSNE